MSRFIRRGYQNFPSFHLYSVVLFSSFDSDTVIVSENKRCARFDNRNDTFPFAPVLDDVRSKEKKTYHRRRWIISSHLSSDAIVITHRRLLRHRSFRTIPQISAT